ncbi:MAG: HhH-GPD family protein, partial [Candidatus Limnocylindrales bacterium]
PASFATAPTRDLLEAWAGLGYNRRALALRDAARRIVTEHGGTVPADVAALEALPGVGPYTARAVAASAFAIPVAPVDVNVRRVISRLSGERSPRAIQAEGDRLIAACRSGPAFWAHAVMDLAATVCTRRDPRCGDCPIAASCRSRGTSGEATLDQGGASSPAFERTNRWLRGRIVARAREAEAGSWIAFDGPIGDHDANAVGRALGDLAAEGFLETDGRRARLRG